MSVVICLLLCPFAVVGEEVEVVAEVAKLLALDGEAEDLFGVAVSLDGDRLVVGAPDDETDLPKGGSVYVFERDGEGSWAVVHKIGGLGQNFLYLGSSLSLDGDRLAIGAPGDIGGADSSGAVYIYERDTDGSWLQVSKLIVTDGPFFSDNFGFSVSLDGDRVVVGAIEDNVVIGRSGSAYVFERNSDGDWPEVNNLVASDAAERDLFGTSVSLDGDRLMVGAVGDDDSGADSGSVYVFERDAGGSWLEVEKILALDGQAGDEFGSSLSLEGDRLAVGAQLDDDNGPGSGSAYILDRDIDGSWLEVGKLLPLDGSVGDFFGESVSLDGDRVAIGAAGDDDNGLFSGSAYVFERDAGGSWFEASKHRPLDGQQDGDFGASVSLDGGNLVVGAIGDDENGSLSGAAYVFEPVLVSPQLTLTGTCPGEIELVSAGNTPRSGVRVYSSTAPGIAEFESGPCTGTVLGLETPSILIQSNTNFDAELNRVRTVDASKCGLYLQVLDFNTCLTSEVVQVP